MFNKRAFLIVGVAAVIAFVGFRAGDWSAANAAAIQVVMYQNPACGCCGEWAKHMERAGFAVEIHKTAELNRIKEREGITAATAACHTAIVDGYVVEGHVPVRDVKRLLRERPDVLGITVPGMPAGSPGMEGPRSDNYDVLTFDKDGKTAVYASY